MSSDLWPAGGIVATLVSPFGPALGARFVNWARDQPYIGPVARSLFPVRVATQEPDAGPQISLNDEFVDRMRGAFREAVEEGLRATGINPELSEELHQQSGALRRLAHAVERSLEEIRGPRSAGD